MKLKEALAHARKLLNNQHIQDASLEAEILLRHILEIDRARLYTESDKDLTESQLTDYLDLVERRCQGEPSAYITGHREFYGLDFIVDSNVLIPRPETELLVEKALEFSVNHQISTIADVGTGCGAIAISLVKKLNDVEIYGLDASEKALDVAAGNCRKHGVHEKIKLVQSDLLESLPAPVGMIIANLPYIKSSEIPGTGPVSFEPVIALDGGPSGLAAIEQLCRQSVGKICDNGCILLEIGQGQAAVIKNIIFQIYPKANVKVYPDYAGIQRVMGIYLTWKRT